MTLAAELGAFVARAEPPASVAPVIGEAVADCAACILAGHEAEVSQRLAGALGGTGPVRILGTDETAPPGLAAMRMAVAGHAHELDDWEEPGNTHPSVVLLPAIWAASHLSPVDGGRFAAAYAVGFEVIARLGQAIGLSHYARGFHTTATLGAIGAAAGAARALALSAEESTHAMCLAASQAQGFTLQFGSDAKPLQAGNAARAGVEAALLARAGCTAEGKMLCDPRGFAGLMGERDAARIAGASARLGTPWALDEFGIILKPWPSCGYTHRLMTAALELRNRVDPSAITAIHAEMPDFHRAILPFDRPGTRVEALFSIPACVAQILAHGDLTLQDSEGRFWEKVTPLAARVRVTAEPARRPDLNYDPDQPDRLILQSADGTHTAACAYPLGAPQNPMSRAQLTRKFAALSGRGPEAHQALLACSQSEDLVKHVLEALS